ncbi:hypothetical protein HN51_001302, partial [Arachis hypogaea]
MVVYPRRSLKILQKIGVTKLGSMEFRLMEMQKKYKYCDKVVTRGVYRLKHHLARTKKDVEPCMGISDEVKKDMFDIVVGLQKNLVKKTGEFEEKIQSKDEGVKEERDALV